LSLRARLILLVIVGIVPLLLFTVAREYFDYQEARANAGTRALELARGMRRVVEQELDKRIAVLQVLTLSPTLQAGDLNAFRPIAEAVVAQQFPGSNMLLLSADGQQVMNTILPREAPLPVRPNLDSLRAMFATGAPVVSNLYIGAVGGRFVVAIDVPVRRVDGSIAYALSINPALQSFSDIIRRQQPPEGWVASVFDGRGVNLARTPDPERFVGQAAAPSLLPRLLAERESIVENTSLEGIALLTAFSRSQQYAWGSALAFPRQR
jgi:hypothetical protein